MEVWHLPFVIRALYTGLGMGAAPLGLAILALKSNNKQRSIIKLLVNSEDKNAIAPLIEALAIGGRQDVAVRQTVASGLVHLLLQLRASDAHLLNDKQRTHLRGALSVPDKALTCAILKALEQIGDTRDILAVEKIQSQDKELMEAAKTCVSFLLARAEQQKVSQTLLRPVKVDLTTSVSLLRPVSGQDSMEAQSLLRARSEGVEDVR